MSRISSLLFSAFLVSTIGVRAETPVAFSGDAAPGGGLFEEFHDFSASPSGGLAFVASLSGADNGVDSGLFLFDGKRIERLLGAGNQQPYRRFVRVSLGDGGQVAAIAETVDASRVLILLSDGVVRLLARQGDTPEGGAAIVDFQ